MDEVEVEVVKVVKVVEVVKVAFTRNVFMGR
jgi:hypothetical protein